MKHFEIYFDDLLPAAQHRYLAFLGVDSPKELNHEYIPLAILDIIDHKED